MAIDAYDNVEDIVDVSGGADVTFGTLIKNINKNIRTCINAIINNKNTFNNRVLGIYSSENIDINVPTKETKTYSIHVSDNIYTHGYVRSTNSSYNTDWLEINRHENSVKKTSTNYWITFELINDTSGTTINVIVFSRGSGDLEGTLTIEYELY